MFSIRAGDLSFRPIEQTDAPQIGKLCNDVAVAHNTASIVHPFGPADADAFIAKRGVETFGVEQNYVFGVCRSNVLIACAGVHGISPGIFEIGYWVGAAYRRQGVATLAARAVTQFAFEALGANTASAGFFTDNPASGRVLERVGFTATGETPIMFSAGRGKNVETTQLALARADFQLSPEIVITPTGP